MQEYGKSLVGVRVARNVSEDIHCNVVASSNSMLSRLKSREAWWREIVRYDTTYDLARC